MTDAAPHANEPAAALNGFIALARNSQEEAMRSWTKGSELWARYIEALVQVRGPSDLLAANIAFMRGSMEAVAGNIATLQETRFPPAAD